MATDTDVTEITVEVFHLAKEDSKSFTWSWTTKVEDAAREAAEAFGVPNPGSATFANEDEETLKREKPLRAADVEEGDELELVDTTGGV